MIDDPVLRWVVTLLFGFSAVQCLWSVITGGRSVTATIGNVLHAVMSLAMAVMAWPAGAELPTRAPMVFFLLAAIWFAVAAARTAGPGGDNVFLAAYHALMMLAMSWMYAVMGGLPLRRAAPAGTAGRQHGAQHGADHGAHHGQHGGGHAAHHGGSDGAVSAMPPWVGLLNWLCAIGFALATVYWLYRLGAGRPGSAAAGLSALSQAAMAAGMAIMFAVML